MDPQETLLRALKALARLESRPADNDEREEASEALEALSEWLRKGGFAPSPLAALLELQKGGQP